MTHLPAGSVLRSAAAYNGQPAWPGAALGQPGHGAELTLVVAGRLTLLELLADGLGGAPGGARSAGGERSERARSGTFQGADELSSDTGETVGTITSCLKMLARENPEHVFVARRVHSLGFESKDALLLHFSGFGSVKQVLAPNSKVTTTSGRERIRPGGIAFVVMADAASVERVLQAGGRHAVASKSITVEPYAYLWPESTATASADSTSAPAGSASSSGGRAVLSTGSRPVFHSTAEAPAPSRVSSRHLLSPC